MQDLTPNSPQVYARLQDGDLTPNGALLAANSIDLQVGGDLTTSGSIAGRQLVSLTAENISNLRGRIAGQSVGVAARNDLTLDGGTISAQDRLIAAAGNTLTVQSSSADLAVLSQDIFSVPPEALPGTTSRLTLVGGKVAWRDPEF